MTAFSQVSTVKSQTDSTAIKLSSRVAREVVKDLIKGDSAIAELHAAQTINNILINSLTMKDSLLNRKDTIISLLKTQNVNNTNIINLQTKQIDSYKNLSVDQQKTIKKYKKRENFHGILIPFLIFGIVFAAIN